MTAIDSVACAWLAGIAAVCTGVLPLDLAAGCSFVLTAISLGWRRAWVVAAALGLSVGACAVRDTEAHRLGACADGANVILDGRITGLPAREGPAVRFEFDVDHRATLERCAALTARRLRLTWFDAPQLGTAERWQLEVRLRPLRNYRNPGGFDYLAWAAERGIDGAGTVRRGIRTEPRDASLDAARAAVGERIDALGGSRAALYRALTIGDGHELSADTWAQFRATGTIHLLVISGLHVSIAAAFGAVVGMGVWRSLPTLSQRRGDHLAAIVGGIVTATLYAALAGFGLPVQRALLMSAAALIWWGAGRELGFSRSLVVVVALLLAISPQAVLDSSLWLSVGAVAVLMGYFAPRRGIRRGTVLLHAQFAMFIGLLPVLVASVGQFSWTAPLANLLAVPLVSLVLVPIMLLAVACLWHAPDIAASLYRVAELVADALLMWLAGLAGFDPGQAVPTAGIPILMALLTASAVLLPLGTMSRATLCLALIAWLVPDRQAVAFGQARVTILDVGQGLSVLVDTAHERMLYDAGPRHPSGFDLGEAVVVPALRATGGTRLDLLIISHADADHAGGAAAVLRLASVRSVLAGEGELAARCKRGDVWQWSGVSFRVLAPNLRAAGNAASCVLHLEARSGAALLPGDVDASSERRLLDRRLGADLLVAPHHGSRSSSSKAFLDAVAPDVIAVSAGHRNSFGHPHPAVLARYAAVARATSVTARDGSLLWDSTRPDVLRSAVEALYE